jgi:hypothetical protein
MCFSSISEDLAIEVYSRLNELSFQLQVTDLAFCLILVKRDGKGTNC